MKNEQWAELIKSKKPELEKSVDMTFESILATDEDAMMASILLWDDGSIETHYRDYKPGNTSMARSAVRIYSTVSRSRADHGKESTEDYMKRMMGNQKPDAVKIVDDVIKMMGMNKD